MISNRKLNLDDFRRMIYEPLINKGLVIRPAPEDFDARLQDAFEKHVKFIEESRKESE